MRNAAALLFAATLLGGCVADLVVIGGQALMGVGMQSETRWPPPSTETDHATDQDDNDQR